jgi:phosphatidylglycerophosphate synthase
MSEQKPDITQGRKRTNLLKNYEQKTIEYLCGIMPNWITSDILTFIGFLGSIIISIGLYFGTVNKVWLGLSILGFAVQWFGDSLDGRLAYWRNKPRKWYGWALDITVDWISICIIGFGFYYFMDTYKYVAFVFIFGYGWAMINALLRYKITDAYSIDSNFMGPTELRIIICIFIIIEYLIPHTLIAFAFVGSTILIYFNILDLVNILKEGNVRDAKEKADKALRG